MKTKPASRFFLTYLNNKKTIKFCPPNLSNFFHDKTTTTKSPGIPHPSNFFDNKQLPRLTTNCEPTSNKNPYLFHQSTMASGTQDAVASPSANLQQNSTGGGIYDLYLVLCEQVTPLNRMMTLTIGQYKSLNKHDRSFIMQNFW